MKDSGSCQLIGGPGAAVFFLQKSLWSAQKEEQNHTIPSFKKPRYKDERHYVLENIKGQKDIIMKLRRGVS